MFLPVTILTSINLLAFPVNWLMMKTLHLQFYELAASLPGKEILAIAHFCVKAHIHLSFLCFSHMEKVTAGRKTVCIPADDSTFKKSACLSRNRATENIYVCFYLELQPPIKSHFFKDFLDQGVRSDFSQIFQTSIRCRSLHISKNWDSKVHFVSFFSPQEGSLICFGTKEGS